MRTMLLILGLLVMPGCSTTSNAPPPQAKPDPLRYREN